MLCLGLFAACPAAAVEDAPDSPLKPYHCEAWQAQVKKLGASADELERELGALYNQPAMRYCKLERRRVARFDWNRETDREGFELPDLTLLGNLLRAVIIAALLGLCLWLLWRWRHVLIDFGRGAGGARTDPIPRPIRARLPEPATLPDDIPAAARKAWRNGDARAAMSLLYRGAVSALLPERRNRQAYTEREVLAQIGAHRQGGERLSYMRRLVDQWLNTAWGEKPPAADAFERLCREWPAHCRGEP